MNKTLIGAVAGAFVGVCIFGIVQVGWLEQWLRDQMLPANRVAVSTITASIIIGCGAIVGAIAGAVETLKRGSAD